MESKNGESWPSEQKRRSQRGKPEGEPRCVGVISGTGGESRTFSLGTSGENSYERDSAISGSITPESIVGKIASQLISEIEKELAYHESQVDLLKDRVQTLKKISEFTEK